MDSKSNTGIYFGVAAVAAAAFILSSTKSKAADSTPAPVHSGDTGKPSEFIAKYLQDAQDAAKNTGVPAMVTLAQAGLESNWGKNAYGNNFFGIKADKHYAGDTQLLKTLEAGKHGNAAKDGITDEVIDIVPPGADGNPFGTKYYAYHVLGKFRKYASARDGFIDHAQFLATNKRYAKAFDYTDPPPFAQAVADAGYATDPNYGSKLVRVVNLTMQLA